MKKKKILKIIGYSLGTLFVLFIALIGVIFYHLPSAKEIGEYFKKEIPKIDQPRMQEQVLESAESFSESVAALSTGDESQVVEPAQPARSRSNVSSETLRKFLDPETPVSEFCNKLGNASSGPMKVFAAQTDEERNQLEEKDFSDLRLEAIMPLVKNVIEKPEMKKLVTMLVQTEGLDESQKQVLEEEGILSKAQFYAQGFLAYRELKSNIEEHEAVVDRTYLFYKLNDLIALKPDLKDDQRVLKFCEDSERLFNTRTPVQFENEKQTFERLMAEVGIDQQQIKYNPDYKTKLSVGSTGNSLNIGGGWLNELVPDKVKN